MDKKKKIWMLASIAVIATILGSILATTMFSISEVKALSRNNQGAESAMLAPPTPIPGVIYTGSYIRIGLNKGGTFGVGKEVDPGTGFQFPIGPQFESLAIFWWGEGYAIFYKTWKDGAWVDNVAYWWPSLGWPIPAASNLALVSAVEKRDDHQGAQWDVTLRTLDKVLEIRFRFLFPKQQKYVILETKITNIGKSMIKDVLYKRYVDWDIHQDTGNLWTSDSHSAYAHYLNRTLGMNIEMSVSGYTKPAWGPSILPVYSDLYAWDDLGLPPDWPPTRDPGEWDIQSHEDSLMMDGAAGIYFDLGKMGSGREKLTYLVYQTGWYDPSWVATGP